VSPVSQTTGFGQTIDLTANAASGYRFVSWSGDVSGVNANISVTMNSNKQVFANFVKQFTLTLSVNPSNTGNVTPNTIVYDQGAQVTLVATAVSGYQFDRWSGDISGTGSSIVVTVNSSMNIVANFGKAPLNVGPTVWDIGTGTGDVISIPPLNIGAGYGNLFVTLNTGDTLSFNFIVNPSQSSTWYWVIDPNGNIVLTGSGGNKVMSGQGTITALVIGSYNVRFESSGILTSTIMTYSYTITYEQP
jgi:hypothetical protein